MLRHSQTPVPRRYDGTTTTAVAVTPVALFAKQEVFEKAYLIHLFQDMVEAGEELVHVDTPGGYIEIDTQEDIEYARMYWPSKDLIR